MMTFAVDWAFKTNDLSILKETCVLNSASENFTCGTDLAIHFVSPRHDPSRYVDWAENFR